MIAMLFVVASSALAQDAPPDSSQLRVDENAYYAIQKTRLTRWVREHRNAAPEDALEQIVQLLEEADVFAREGDYETALLYLQTAAEIKSSVATGQMPGDFSADSESALSAEAHLKPQFITGVDLWRQQFESRFIGLNDTTFYENTGNPYAGLRLQGNWQSRAFGTIDAFGLAKASRDYYTGEIELRNQKGNYNRSHWALENRFEWTGYQDSLALEFLQYSNSLRGGVELVPKFTVFAGNEFRLRRYSTESIYYPNYRHNFSYAGFQFASGLSSRLWGRASYATRKHPNARDDDYAEATVEASIYQLTAINSSIFIENIYRIRNYTNGGNDSTYQNSFREEYLRGDFRFGITPQVSFDLSGDVSVRQHKIASLATPDFLNITANPRFLFQIYSDWQIGLGYLYILRVYSRDIIKTSAAALASDVSLAAHDTILGYEDYFSHGISISLELFRLGAFMLNLSNNLEYRTYPNSKTNNINGFPLYTDRRINSTFLLLNWKVHPQIEIGVLGNFDQDRSRRQEHDDSRNTLFSLEVGYSFN